MGASMAFTEDKTNSLQDIEQNFQSVLEKEEEEDTISDTETIEEEGSDDEKSGSVKTEDGFKQMNKLKATNFDAALLKESNKVIFSID